MAEYTLLLGAVAPIFLLILLGFGFRRMKLLTPEADNALLRINFNVLYPCFIFFRVLGNDALKDARNLVIAPLAGFFIILVGFAICNVGARLSGVKDAVERRTFAFTTAIPNYGYLPIPLAQRFFSTEVLGVLFLFNLGVETAMWTIGVILLSGGAGGQAWKKVINGPSVTVVVALACNAMGLETLPGPLATTVEMLGACSIPFGLLLVGAVMSDLAHKLDFVKNWNVVLGSNVLRMGLLSAATFALAAAMPGITTELRQVLLLQGSMPCAVVPVVMARMYKASEAMAIQVIFATTALGLFVIPLLIKVGAWYIGHWHGGFVNLIK
jgi:predicted permease